MDTQTPGEGVAHNRVPHLHIIRIEEVEKAVAYIIGAAAPRCNRKSSYKHAYLRVQYM